MVYIEMAIIDFEQRFPYKGKTSCLHEDVVKWLETHVGKFDYDWYRYGTDIAMATVEGAYLYDYYRFRTEESAMLFILRWS